MVQSKLYDAVKTKKGWQHLIQTLQKVGETIESSTEGNDILDIVEGYRHALRLASVAINGRLERADPLRPFFYRWGAPTQIALGGNPDVFYDSAPIDGSQSYRITGIRGTVIYIGFTIYKPSLTDRISAHISDKDISIGPNNTFELILSPENHDGNWVKLEPEANRVVVRQYFLDKEKEIPATYGIELISKEPSPPPPLTDKLMRKLLTNIATFIRNFLMISANTLRGPPNQFIVRDSSSIAGTPDIQYMGTRFRVNPDEAFIITVKPPESRYWSIQLFNQWAESLDYRFHQVSINKSQAVLEPNGLFKVVVAHFDPGIPNWLDTTGHSEGLVFFRWLFSKEGPVPQCELVSLDKIDECIV